MTYLGILQHLFVYLIACVQNPLVSTGQNYGSLYKGKETKEKRQKD